MNSTTFVLFGKYCLIVDQLDSKDSSLDFQLNCVISYFWNLDDNKVQMLTLRDGRGMKQGEREKNFAARSTPRFWLRQLRFRPARVNGTASRKADWWGCFGNTALQYNLPAPPPSQLRPEIPPNSTTPPSRRRSSAIPPPPQIRPCRHGRRAQKQRRGHAPNPALKVKCLSSFLLFRWTHAVA
jgi:hypothetical protein